jgi:hypothetical protein
VPELSGESPIMNTTYEDTSGSGGNFLGCAIARFTTVRSTTVSCSVSQPRWTG